MAIKTRLIDEDRDNLTKDVNDLDAAYLERMKEDGNRPRTFSHNFVIYL